MDKKKRDLACKSKHPKGVRSLTLPAFQSHQSGSAHERLRHRPGTRNRTALITRTEEDLLVHFVVRFPLFPVKDDVRDAEAALSRIASSLSSSSRPAIYTPCLSFLNCHTSEEVLLLKSCGTQPLVQSTHNALLIRSNPEAATDG